eukprot:1156263-Pelagomonas_calceolata.AAC.9
MAHQWGGKYVMGGGSKGAAYGGVGKGHLHTHCLITILSRLKIPTGAGNFARKEGTRQEDVAVQ